MRKEIFKEESFCDISRSCNKGEDDLIDIIGHLDISNRKELFKFEDTTVSLIRTLI
jgi:hypothetical protein